MEWLTPALVIVTSAALVAVPSAVVSVFWARRSWPIAQRATLQAMLDRVQAAEAIVDGLQAKWTAKAAEIGAVLEEVEGVLESVERKRRRTAATEAKLAQRDEQPGPETREQALARLRALARARGISV